MVTPQNIILICWIIFCVFWIISLRSVKRTQEMKARGVTFDVIIIGAIIGLVVLQKLGVSFLQISLSPLTTTFIQHSYLLNFISIFLVIIGLFVAIYARYTLGSNWSAHVEMKVKHELITTGMYKYVRHPIYTGVILMRIGSVLVVGTVNLLLFFFIGAGYLIYRLVQEEQLLIKYFPKEYPEYKKRTKALIPFIL